MIGIKKTANTDINMGRVERVKKIVRLVVVFNIFLLSIYFLMNNLNFWLIATKTTIIVSISLGIVYLVNKFLWKYKFLSFLFDSPPNIEGEWRGIIVNTNDGKKQKMIMKIEQTYLEVFITVQAERGTSTTYAGDIVKFNGNNWKLMWTWHSSNKAGEFSGTTIVDILNENELKGFYFTNSNVDGRGCTSGKFEAKKVIKNESN